MEQVGHYQLLELIGEGGMARVYRARDLHLQREVAVKILTHQGVCSPTGAARFRREARLAAALRHPNIVTVHDCSPPDSAVCYLASELISGGTLRQEVDRPLLGEEAALLLLPVTRALAAAHAQGIIHRDVKPDNILIDRNEGAAAIKLADFGVAVQHSDPRVTTDGSVSGSVIYMAPEQLQEGAATPASDVWAVGITLCELVAGRAPLVGLPLAQIISRLTEGQVPIPAAGLSPALAALLRRCLAADPAARYANGAELAAALEQLLAAAAISQPDEELQRRLQDPAGYRAALALRLADQLVTAAAGAPLAGRADLLDRALSLVPDHAGALALLDPLARAEVSLGARSGGKHPARSSRRLTLAAAAAAILLCGGGITLALLAGPTESPAPGHAISQPQRGTAGRPVPAAATSPAQDSSAAAAEPGASPPSVLPARPEHDPGAEVALQPGRAAKPRRSAPASTAGRGVLEPRQATLVLTTTPWAEVLLDGRSLGYTPRVSKIPLSPGSHQLVLKNPLCQPHSETLSVAAGELALRSIKLELLLAQLSVEAPAGWSIRIDGVLLGNAPLTQILRVSHGSHQVQARGPGGQELTRQVQAVAGKHTQVRLMAAD